MHLGVDLPGEPRIRDSASCQVPMVYELAADDGRLVLSDPIIPQSIV